MGRRQNAGALMGQGSYGCTFLPAVPCADKSGKPHPIKPNRIGKVFGLYQSAAEELAYARIVKKIDPQQRLFYYPDEACFSTPSDVQKELASGETCETMKSLPPSQKTAVELLMPNGGQIITEYLNTTFGYGRMPRATMAGILERLFFGVRRLIEAGYVHQDLKMPNIVAFAGPNGSHEVRIIDFGNISSFADFYHGDTNFMMQGHEYFVNPPEYRIPPKLEALTASGNSASGKSASGKSASGQAKLYAAVVTKIKQDEIKQHSVFADSSLLASYRVGYTGTGDFVPHNVMALERFISAFNGRDYNGRMKVLEGMNGASKSDVWSMGTIMVSLTKYLIPAANDDAEAVNIYSDMVSGLLQPNPAERMSIGEALRMIKRLKRTGVLGSPVQNDHFQAVFQPSPSLPLPTHPARPMTQRPMTQRPMTQRQMTQRQMTQRPMTKRLPTQTAPSQSVVASNKPNVTLTPTNANQPSPTPKTKLSRRLYGSTVRDLRASDLYKQLAITGKSRFKKDELIRAIVKNVLP